MTYEQQLIENSKASLDSVSDEELHATLEDIENNYDSTYEILVFTEKEPER